MQPASNLEQSSDRASKKNLMDSSGSLKKVPWDLTLTPARTDSNLNPFLMKSAFGFNSSVHKRKLSGCLSIYK